MHLVSARSIRFLALTAAALIACSGSGALAAPTPTSRILVKFRTAASPAAAHSTLSSVGARDLRTINGVGVQVVVVSSDRTGAAIAALRRSPAIAYAEIDGRLAPQELLPSDPSFPQQFALAGGAWGWARTHTTQAWDITKGNASVTVAVLDTGLKTAGLTDFDGQIVPGWNVMNASVDTSSSAGNHGTYVAGVVGLAANNAAGNAGYCPGCTIMPVQVGSDSGAYVSDIASGITWAADHGARVENISFGGTSASSTLTNAVAYARAKGVVVTAAAGNSNCDCPTYPAATPGVIGVAGTSNLDAKQGDSNYGAWVEVAAPESNMTSWPTMNGSPGYAPLGGTSLAAPVVAGIAGLLFSAKPGLSGAQVEQALEASSTPVGFAVQHGRVDTLAALNYLGLRDPQPQTAPTVVQQPEILLETNGDYNTVPLARAPQAGDVLLRGQGAWTGMAPLSLTSVQWQRCDFAGSACATIGTASRYTVQSGDAGYTFRLSVSVKNGIGTVTAASPLSQPVGGSIAVLPPLNTSPPTINGLAVAGQTLSASDGSWSGSPTSFAYQWNRCDAGGAACATIGGGSAATYVVQDADVGSTLRLTVTASNSAGQAIASSDATQAVAAAPASTPPTAGTQTLTFSGSLSPKASSRAFNVTVGSGAAHAELAFARCSALTLGMSNGAARTGPSVVALDASVAAGTYTYTVSGGKCSFTLTVTAPAA